MTTQFFHVQIVLVLVNLTLGYLVWTYNSRSNLNRILTSIIACILLIDASLLFHLRIEERSFMLGAIILESMGIAFFPPILYTLSLYYPMKRSFKAPSLILFFGVAALFAVVMTTTFPRDMFAGRISLNETVRPVSLSALPLAFMSLYFLFMSFSTLLFLLTTGNLLTSLKSDVIPYERRTVRLLVVVGLPLAYLISVVSVANFFFEIPFPWIGFLLAVFTAFTVFLVFRFHLVDLKRLIKGILFFPALIAIIVFVYIYFILRNQAVIAAVLNLPESVTLVLEVFVIYMIVSTLRRINLFGSIGRRFPGVLPFSGIEPVEYLSYARTLQDLSRRLSRVFETNYRVERVTLLLLDRERELYVHTGGSGDPAGGHGGGSITLTGSGELVKTLARIDRGVTLEELLVLMNKRVELKTLYEWGCDLLLPITKGRQMIAVFLVSKPGLIQRWSGEDISSLENIKVMLPSLIERCAMFENEREIEKHQYRMEQLQIMAQMASGLAHEIRNPLSIISTSVETMMREDVQPEDKRKMLQYIREESERINILSNKLLSVKFQQKPEMEIVEIRSLCFRLKEFLKYMLKDKNAEFRIAAEDPCFLYTDSTILFQILLNLALNSLEAIGEGGSILVGYRKEQSVFRLWQEDDGPGVPEENRSRIFEPFFTTRENGSGLGLTITGKLVETLFGHIELLPAGDLGGARFMISLPIFQSQEAKRRK